MKNCSNCFNGCVEPTSDKCVKYTGVDIPSLGIDTGDPLNLIEEILISKVQDIITGDGIIPVINGAELCTIISSYLPASGDITLNHVISALIRSICEIDSSILSIEGELNELNASYVVDCLVGVDGTSDTHEVVQAIIEELCTVKAELDALELSIPATYVRKDELDGLIQDYIDDVPTTNLVNSKMLPYAAIAYFGDLAGKFDATGAGIGDWDKVYLCNGQHGTPDLRGITLVGVTNMAGGGTYPPATDPGIAGNPTYTLNGPIQGKNVVVLTPEQLPPHSHGATATVIDPGHTHNYQIRLEEKRADFANNENVSAANLYETRTTASSQANITVSVAVNDAGGGIGHENVQPSKGVNYIMFIP
jgi:microcystin-dependent protein